MADDATDEYHIICATQGHPHYNVPPCTFPVDPGPLLPNTTYYWRAWSINSYSIAPTAMSETFTFTTGGPVATQPSTWGRVKAMYRK